VAKYDFSGSQGNFQIESSGTQINNVSFGSLQQAALAAANALENDGSEDARAVARDLRAEAAKPESAADRKWMKQALEWAKVVVPAAATVISGFGL
jgi:hypothetical protein